MKNMADLHGRTIVMSGGSRGIGLAIAIAAAKAGANTVLLAKTDKPHPKLPGTVHTAVDEIEAVGGKAVAVVGDVRNDDDVERAVHTAVERFGGVDIVVNNASAISVDGTEALSMKQFDLMAQINVRGTFALTRACIPFLRRSENPHILTVAPPLNFAPHWLGAHPGYTVTKYGMSLLTMSWAAEFADAGIAANCLWPQTKIATAAVVNLLGGDEAASRARSPQIMGDAAVTMLNRPAKELTGQCLIDVDVLAEAGITDLAPYGGGPHPDRDIYVD
jgi:NAD(P)-dependent dehydrogenase (short-subunit alcohol dehydrogenase family)